MSLFNFIHIFLIDLIITLVFIEITDLLCIVKDSSFVIKFEEINENIILYMIIGGVFFPILEEFLHRYYLDYKSKSLLISTILILLYFFLDFNVLNPLQSGIHFSFFLFLIVILFLKKFYNYINFRLLVWGSILFFGLFHLSTYERDIYSNNYFIIFVLVTPQFIGGFFLAFIRSTYRFIHCIIYHSFFNLVLFSIGYIVYKLFPQ